MATVVRKSARLVVKQQQQQQQEKEVLPKKAAAAAEEEDFVLVEKAPQSGAIDKAKPAASQNKQDKKATQKKGKAKAAQRSPSPPPPESDATTNSDEDESDHKHEHDIQLDIEIEFDPHHDHDDDDDNDDASSDGGEADLASLLAGQLDGSPVGARVLRAGPRSHEKAGVREKLSRRGARRVSAVELQIEAYKENNKKRVVAAAAAAAAATATASTTTTLTDFDTLPSDAATAQGKRTRRPTARTRKDAVKKTKDMRARLSHKHGLDLDSNETITTHDYWFGEPAPLDRVVAACVRDAPVVAPTADERCCICMEDFLSSDPEVVAQYAGQRVVQMPKCAARHPFHSDCLTAALTMSPRCPVCMVPVAPACGTQPHGVMTLQRIHTRLPGEGANDTVVVSYSFPSGTQGPRHPAPGRPYYGTGRTAYFPYSAQGRKTLQQLMRAWDARVLFTVGTSVTTGASDCVVWNGVHHKTSMSGGPAHYGYPDATYLDRVAEEMASVGVF